MRGANRDNNGGGCAHRLQYINFCVSQTLSGTSGISLLKSRDIRLKEIDSEGFEGQIKLIGPQPFTCEAPLPQSCEISPPHKNPPLGSFFFPEKCWGFDSRNSTRGAMQRQLIFRLFGLALFCPGCFFGCSPALCPRSALLFVTFYTIPLKNVFKAIVLNK